ncbi:MAG: hydantoinase B/oxoprolinase family protein [Bacteroidota bacterium]
MTKLNWQLWIDTGGTFTDCISIDTKSNKQRIKVLSSATLRAVITQKIRPNVYAFQHNWTIGKDIFKNYHFYALPSKTQVSRVVTVDLQKGEITLADDLNLPPNCTFEITAHEEAPILAARLATQTTLSQPLPDIDMRLGTTKGTNALLERKGAKVTLLITKGFRDLLHIGTQQRPHLFQLNIPEPELLYDQVIEVDERLAADGQVLRALTDEVIQKVIQQVDNQVVSIALLHSYLNPIHEQELQSALFERGIVYCSTSHELSPNIQLLPRANTALINAYLQPILTDYLQHIRSKLTPNSQLKVMSSVGGLVSSVFFQPKDSLLSGPAGGIVGAAAIARQLGIPKILTLDMGGTSTDTARFDGVNYDYETTTKVGHAEMLSLTLSIETVAAGGGSICWFDGERLRVGPESTGASPGPACYGAGGALSVTDVNLLLGKLDVSAMGIPIDQSAAEAALQEIQKAIFDQKGEQLDRETLLQGFEQIANEKMAEAIRKISVAKGFDMREYALLVFGGAGGLHACQIADLLHIQQIVLPFDGGLLSAYGMGMAQLERLVEQQILSPLSDLENELASRISTLEAAALKQLKEEGIAAKDSYIKSTLVYLRLRGQDSTLAIEWTENDLATAFREAYIDLFGHYPKEATIEVESIKVRAANQQHHALNNRRAQHKKHIQPGMENGQFPVYRWEELKEGNYITAPTILVNATSTAFIAPNWSAHVQRGGDILLQREKMHNITTDATQSESVALELFTNRFRAIAEEMGVQLQRTAFSVNIKERLDFSCAILDADAQLLVNAPHIPVHLGSLGICARLMIQQLELEEGDIAITNHPKYGGSHLPDVTLLQAVFDEQGERVGYVINRAHHAEIGGRTPGSMPPDATRLVEEGVAIVPTYLVKKGVPQWESMTQLFTQARFPTRAWQENKADLSAAIAALRTGEQKLKALVRQHSSNKVKHYMKLLQHVAAQNLERAIAPWRGQQLSAQEQLDDGHTIRLAIQIGEQIEFDFSGTDAPHPHNLNANISIVYSAILYVLRLLCAEELPLNEGLMQQVKVKLPESFLHPRFEDEAADCPAVVGGNTEVSQRLVDTLLKVFQLAACSQGTMNNFLFGNERFGYYETICGGTGAGYGFNGRSAVHQHMTNTKITDPEILELRYPVRLQEFSIRKNSGGQGKWKGGNGIRRVVELLEDMTVTLISQHRQIAPYGMDGGEAGQVGKQYLRHKNGKLEVLEGIISRNGKTGQQILIETPGGGGWGVQNDE